MNMRFHIVKRENCPLWKKCCLYLGAVVLALALGAILLAAMGVNPIAYYGRMFTMGTVGNKIAYKVWINYLKEFVPLALVSVALSLAFKMRFWNIGGEGQFVLGSIAAAFVAFKAGPMLPGALTLLLMCLAAVVVSGLYGLFVAALKVKFGTNETLMTLMLNYVALYVLVFISETKADWNFFLDSESVRPVFASFAKTVSFPVFPLVGKFRLNICVIFTLLIGVIIFIYLKRTKQGYEIAVVFISETKADWNFFLEADSLRPVFANFSNLVSFPSIPMGRFGLNVCVIFSFLVGAAVFVYLKYTKQGYEIAVVGDSAGTARYAGMKVNTIVLRTVFLSAGLIGLAAAFKVGTAGILSTAITGDVGWTGIIVAWLSQLNTAVIFVVSALICVLHYGSTVAASTFAQVDSSFANMLQGVILFLVLAADFLIRFQIVPTKKGGKDNGNG